MSKSYRPWLPRQSFLLPPSPMEWLPDDHLVYFLLDVVEEIDLSAIENAIQEKDGRGTRPFDPRMMVALLLYGYCNGIRSSRKLEQATHVDIAFRVLTGGQTPEHSAIADFRQAHRKALDGLFVKVLDLCRRAGLVKLGHVALDGTKLKANASKHKAMSHKRMVETQTRLEEEVKQLLDEAERVDREEDARHGVGKRIDELPQELRRREDRLRKIREAKAAIEAEAARTRAMDLRQQEDQARKAAFAATDDAARNTEERRADRIAERAQSAAEKTRKLAKEREDAARKEKERSEDGSSAERQAATRAHDRAMQDLAKALAEDLGAKDTTEFPEHRVQADRHGDPDPAAQRNFTDPDSRIQKTNDGYVQGYNAQLAVDADNQVIVACGLTNQPPDAEHLPPMLDQILFNCGEIPRALTADAGYWAEANVRHCEERGVDPHISVARARHSMTAEKPARNPAMETMREKLSAPDGRALYARRKAVVEPVIGQIKEPRRFRTLLLRGLAGAATEWSLACTCHNLLKLVAHRRAVARRCAT
jgi:transposase